MLSLGLSCSSETTNRKIHMASGQSCVIKELVLLPVKIQWCSWKYKFMVLNHSLVPCILGADFLGFAKMQLDFSTSTYCFAFQEARQYDFEPVDSSVLHSCSFPVE
jgi:hypothetical protein